MTHQSSSPSFSRPVCDDTQFEQRRMPRKGGLTTLLNALLCLSFLPSSLLALQLDVPTRSSDGGMMYFKWTKNDEDPQTIYLQLVCGPVIMYKFSTRTSDLQTSSLADPRLTLDKSLGTCRLSAFRDGFQNSIAQTDTFQSIPVETQQAISTNTRVLTKTNTAPPSGTKIISEISIQATSHSSDALPPTNSSAIFPSSGVTGSIPTTSANTTGSEPESTRHTSPQGALIGGILGGLALLASFNICLCLRLRRIKKRSSSTITASSQQRRITEDHGGAFEDLHGTRPHILSAGVVGRSVTVSWVLSPFRRQPAQSSIVNPMIQIEGYLPQEGKRERMERSHREMEESRRQREMLQSDLESLGDRVTVGNGLEAGLDVEFERLKQQIEAMNRRIQGLEAERLEVEASPPAYDSSVG